VLLLAVWGPVVPSAFDPDYDFENFGMPLILFDPWASFVGWLVLMILISPFLQSLTTAFGGCVALVTETRTDDAAECHPPD
jgi:hypothetical protein